MCNLCQTPSFTANVGRRRILAMGAGLAGIAGAASSVRAAVPVVGQEDAAKALADLVAGNVRYVENQPKQRDFAVGRQDRAMGQSPHAAVLCCSDSRVAPEFAFDQGPGALFVVRIAGNFVTSDGLASLEYAVEELGTRLIVVLGHSQCGAVSAALKVMQDRRILPGHIPDLVRAMKPGLLAAFTQGGPDMVQHAVEANVRYNVRRLQHSPPLIAAYSADNRIKIVGGVYEIASGKVTIFE